MKKGRRLIISLLLVVALSFGVMAYASQGGDASPSKGTEGTFVSVQEGQRMLTIALPEGEREYPLAQSVWVYRNEQKAGVTDLRPGDRIELILNSKKQAAYIKAYSKEAWAAQQAGQAAAAGTAASAVPGGASAKPDTSTAPSVQPSTTPAPAASSGIAPSASAPAMTPAQKPADETGKSEAWNAFKLQVKGAHLSLEAKQERDKDGLKSEVKVDGPDRTKLRLQGREAEDVIRQLLGMVDLNSPDAEQALARLIAGQFGFDPAAIQVKLDVKKSGGPEAASEQQKAKASPTEPSLKPSEQPDDHSTVRPEQPEKAREGERGDREESKQKKNEGKQNQKQVNKNDKNGKGHGGEEKDD